MAGATDFVDDSQAVAAALNGRQAGFTWLMDRHRASVFRYARGQVRDDDEALDITQECFVSAFAALRRYDPARPFRTWLLAIAVNKCRDWARRRAVRRFFTFAMPLDDALSVSDDAPDPESALGSAQHVDRIRSALAALPANLREPLVLCTLEGMDQIEAGAVLGISRKAVETRIYRARQKLTEILAENSSD
ncbi:RNA polymerase sigma factor [Croceicoccus bisphenolivorans]|uniref:RNA polymerase sigma factor n=1 Tax=Croceicoccus bisphenolivorans TaxID=1783232 RepID=UPI00082C3531|nr:RNA polymerase sigma factor [Croceicoccus bisphenolivorans]